MIYAVCTIINNSFCAIVKNLIKPLECIVTIQNMMALTNDKEMI